MSNVDANAWLVICGLGAAWLGWQILVVGGGLPNAVRRRELPALEKGSAAAFQRFWGEQYRFIGLTLSVGGVLMTIVGTLR